MSKARDLASAAPAPSTVSAAELGYLDGVTSAIQTQLNAKASSSDLATGNYAAGKNKITNGAMQIAQRGTSFNFPTGGRTRFFGADRWFTEDYTWSAGSNLTVSNDSTVYPDGFSRSIKVATGATALTLAAGGNIFVEQFIEGSNIASLYKSSSVTLSFYVRSSVTGTYSILLSNGYYGAGTATRGLVKEYTINAANTWERKSIVVDMASGTSAGTWNTNTSIGLSLQFNLGANASRVGNAYLNNWATYSANEVQSSSSVQWTSNANATFYLTGVQLEEGSVATAFQTATGTIQGELAACQRYYYRTSTPATAANGYVSPAGVAATSGRFDVSINAPVTMRVAATSIDYSALQVRTAGGSIKTITAAQLDAASASNVQVRWSAATFTVGEIAFLETTTTSGYWGLSAEL